MKALILTAAIALTATTASAFDVNSVLSVDNTVETWYNVDNKTWTATYEIKPMYEIAPSTHLFVMTDGNLRKASYDGMELGVEHQLDTSMAETLLTAKFGYDKDGKRTDFMVGAEFKF